MGMNLVQILLIAVVVLVVIVRRFAGAPVRARSLVLPLAIAAYGVYALRGAHLGTAEVAFLAL